VVLEPEGLTSKLMFRSIKVPPTEQELLKRRMDNAKTIMRMKKETKKKVAVSLPSDDSTVTVSDSSSS
jgi:hypothetical protein